MSWGRGGSGSLDTTWRKSARIERGYLISISSPASRSSSPTSPTKMYDNVVSSLSFSLVIRRPFCPFCPLCPLPSVEPVEPAPSFFPALERLAASSGLTVVGPVATGPPARSLSSAAVHSWCRGREVAG